MQILPTIEKHALLGDALLASLGAHTDAHADTDAFRDALLAQQAARQAVTATQAVSVQAALESPAPSPLSQAPYSRNTTDGVTYTTDEVSFTKPELAELHHKLEVHGAPPETLRGLEALMEQPDGATLAQVIASLHAVHAPVTLSEAEQIALQSFGNKIDPSGALGERLISLAQEGKGPEIWKQVTAALQKLPAGSTFTADRDEVSVLGKAMGLSTMAQQQTIANFGSLTSATVSREGFDVLMAPAQRDLMLREQNQQKLDTALNATLKPLLKKAKDRMEAEKATSEHTHKRTAQSKVLIEKTVLRHVEATMDDTRQAPQVTQVNTVTQKSAPAPLSQADAVSKAKAPDTIGKPVVDVAQAPQDAQTPRDARPQATAAESPQKMPQQVTLPTQAPQVTQQAAHEPNRTPLPLQGVISPDTPRDTQRDARHDSKGGFGQGERNTSSRDSGWDPLLQKTEVRTSAASSSGTANLTTLAGMGSASAMTDPQPGRPPASTTPLAPRHALSQVEQAVLSALRDGTKRLELQLDPVDLGVLTLTLTSRNGEVSATIRSERGETADMITRQLDVLRTNLEQQGIKVDKLEVRNQAPDNGNASLWDGMQQHNARQEESARRDTLDRLRHLGRGRNDGENGDDSLLEQGMQLPGHTAGNAAQGLHIIT